MIRRKKQIKLKNEEIGTCSRWMAVNSYFEEKRPVTVDPLANHANRNNIRLKLKLELAEVQLPWEFMQLFHLHCSAHSSAY